MRDSTDALTNARRRRGRPRHLQGRRRPGPPRGAQKGGLRASEPDLWMTPDRAAGPDEAKHAWAREDVELVDGLDRRISDLETLHQLAREEGDETLEPEIEAGLRPRRFAPDRLESQGLVRLATTTRLATPSAIHSGAGGTDAQDWAHMLFRIPHRLAEAAASTSRSTRSWRRHRGRPRLPRHSSPSRDATPTACSLKESEAWHRPIRIRPTPMLSRQTALCLLTAFQRSK